jgi:hypothetical protein
MASLKELLVVFAFLLPAIKVVPSTAFKSPPFKVVLVVVASEFSMLLSKVV